MSLPMHTAAVRIRRELRDAEAKSDAALLAKARLLETMLLARQSADVEINTGQRAIIRLSHAIQSQVNVATDLFRVHDEMVKIGRETGIADEDGATRTSGLDDRDLLKVA
jgi:hypothetical protein